MTVTLFCCNRTILPPNRISSYNTLNTLNLNWYHYDTCNTGKLHISKFDLQFLFVKHTQSHNVHKTLPNMSKYY